MHDDNEIGKRIKKIRCRYRMTQQQFGDIIGKSGATVAAYEDGKRVPDLRVLSDISSMFEVSFSYLINGSLKDDPDDIEFLAERSNKSVDEILAMCGETRETALLDEFRKRMYSSFDNDDNDDNGDDNS